LERIQSLPGEMGPRGARSRNGRMAESMHLCTDEGVVRGEDSIKQKLLWRLCPCGMGRGSAV
jgi:hypothetical protein